APSITYTRSLPDALPIYCMWQVTPAGDRGLLVTLGHTIDPALLGQVLALDKALADRRPSGLISTVPAYASLLCHYDAGVTDTARSEEHTSELQSPDHLVC